MSKKLIVFDVDGVLLNNKLGGFKEMLIILGKEKEVKIIDEEYQKRKHLGPWGLEELSKLYEGFSENNLSKTSIEYCKQNLQKGVQETINEFKKRGFLVGALSSNPQFIMDSLGKMFSLDFSEGTRLEFKKGVATGKIKKKVDRYKKAKILEEKIKDYKVGKKDIIVVGDSITDLPMAGLAGTFVAFCPKDKLVKEKANKIIENFQELKELLLCIK